MYGPPDDPRQHFAPTTIGVAPGAWLACVVIGLAIAALAGPRRRLPFVLGLTLALTTPFGVFFATYVWGAFPTIDKAGSLMFYLDGVHRRFWDASDPGVRLIGVHMGHLWVTALFDTFLEPFAAFNLQAFLNLVFSWWLAAVLFEELGAERRAALLLAFPYGMGLHLFRDINWYTIEKSGIYWLPLYAWTLLRARRGGWWILAAGVVYAGMFFYNVYLGVLGAGMGALALFSRDRRVAMAVGASALAALPLVWIQARAMSGPGALGDPETFLTQRAALDTFEIWPPRWNRLEAWRALDLVGVALAAWGATRRRNLWLLAFALPFFVLALGPTRNPVYLALFEVVPGFWRVAKPETFFHVTWLALLAVAARQLTDLRPTPRALTGLALLMGLGWVLSVRTHPVYPRFTLPDVRDGRQKTLPHDP
jgi:hypothetical protein